VASFYSRISRRSNAGLHKERVREVTARHGSRVMGVHTCATRHSNDVVVVVACMGVPAHGAYGARG
jgi:hypothetical protein